METLIVRQIERKGPCKHVMLHELPLPQHKDDGFYRTMISYGAFFTGAKRRNWSKEYLFVAVDNWYIPSEYEVNRDRNLLVRRHDNLLDFFRSIGYDRKSKKFTN